MAAGGHVAGRRGVRLRGGRKQGSLRKLLVCGQQEQGQEQGQEQEQEEQQEQGGQQQEQNGANPEGVVNKAKTSLTTEPKRSFKISARPFSVNVFTKSFAVLFIGNWVFRVGRVTP